MSHSPQHTLESPQQLYKSQQNSLHSPQQSQNSLHSPQQTRHSSHSPQQSRHSSHSPQKTLSFQDEALSTLQPAVGTPASLQQRCAEVTSTKPAYIVVLVFTLFALFGRDVFMACFNVADDIIYDVLAFMCIFIFFAEIVLLSIGVQGYCLNFFFWVDVVATLTLVLDVTNSLNAGRLAQLGARAGRVFRIVKLGRILKVYKLNTALNNVSNGAQPRRENRFSVSGGTSLKNTGDYRETRVGRELSNRTTRGVIILVLLMLLCHPFFMADVFIKKLGDSARYGLTTLDNAYLMEVTQPHSFEARQAYDFQVHSFVAYHVKNKGIAGELMFLKLPRSLLASTSLTLVTWENAEEDEVAGGTGAGDGGTTGSSLSQLRSPSEVIHQPLTSALSDSEGVEDEWSYKTIDQATLELLASPAAANGGVSVGELRLSELRLAEKVHVGSRYHSVVFNIKGYTRVDSVLSICHTIFVCVVLLGFALQFSLDAHRLVLRPIETMMHHLNIIRRNPLAAIRLGEDLLWRDVNKTLRYYLDAKSKGNSRNGWLRRLKRYWEANKSEKDPLETLVIEEMIVKTGTLMMLGFGEAGADIISKNLSANSTNVNPMIPGRKVTAVFGFCDIRNFTDTTEVLREEVMVFVNRIAEIVHTVVDDFSGSANKNIGDAFLMVWKFPERHPYNEGEVKCRINSEDNSSSFYAREVIDREVISRTVEMAIMSFLKIIARMCRCPALAEYAKHSDLKKRMGDQYQVRMGFGLHVGWAIEGAIGSHYKIDASYLSPNVNMAARLEAATKQFGVPILISGEMYKWLSPSFQSELRPIDCVTMKGCEKPLDLYTVDVNTSSLRLHSQQFKPLTDSLNTQSKWGMLRKLHAQKNKRQYRRMLWNPDLKISSFFQHDGEIRALRKHVPEGFCINYGR
eukprot:GHVN01094665.1.p1 GENE.GHVN01094665.1~~GHVN01094665.1.p1  ORF type:complete len:911 (-),score=217.07 GHVN01094665.1:119-2851(-)